MLDRCSTGTIRARGYRSYLIRVREISVRSDLVGSNRCLWIRAREIGACGSMLDRVLHDRSCGSMLVTEMVWIRPRGRVDLCSEIGREMGIEREQQIRKNG